MYYFSMNEISSSNNNWKLRKVRIKYDPSEVNL
jgi:hypothetical protein